MLWYAIHFHILFPIFNTQPGSQEPRLIPTCTSNDLRSNGVGRDRLLPETFAEKYLSTRTLHVPPNSQFACNC